MSTSQTAEVTCPQCAELTRVEMVESANAERAPRFKAAILAGSLHSAPCEECGAALRVERDLLYTELGRGVMIGCFAQTRQAESAHVEAQIAEAWAQTIEVEAPQAVSRSFVGPGPRVVFGLARLREKIVCFDAGLDDRLVEAMKLTLLDGIARREAAGVVDLVLVEVNSESQLLFQPIGVDGGAQGGHLLRVDGAMYQSFDDTRDSVEALLPGLFAGLYVHHGNRHRAV